MRNRDLRFSDAERRGVYRAIYERRDIRSEFLPDPIPDDMLGRLLDAAHHAPSVGFMQPWGFVVLRDPETRRRIHSLFQRANQKAAERYQDERRALYSSLKLAGILDTPVNLCVTCDATVTRGHGLGRQTMPEMVQYSTVCAVQNLWLAARAEGIGVGWVSILDPDELRQILGIPPHLRIVAYLCIGYVSTFERTPELQRKGWERRAALPRLVHFEHFGNIDEQRVEQSLLASRHISDEDEPSTR